MIKKVLFYLSYLLAIAFISFFLYQISLNSFIKPIYGLNSVEIWFSYLEQDANFTLNTYDENKKEAESIVRYFTIDSFVENSGTHKENKIVVSKTELLLPFHNAHKIDFVFEGENNLVYIKEIKANGKEVSLSKFSSLIESNQKFKIGTQKEDDGIYVLLQEPKVVFDVTKALDLPKITQKEVSQLNEDAKFLRLIWFILCFATTYAIFGLLKHIGKKVSNRSKNSQHESSYNNLLLWGMLTLAIIANISNSYYLLNANLFDYAVETAEKIDITLLFLQNYGPMLLGLLCPMTLGLFFKNKIVRTTGVIVTCSFLSIVIVDNAIQNSIGTRLNFNFIGKFAGDTKYVTDFVFKYLHSVSGNLIVVAALIALGMSIWLICSSKLKASFRTFKYYVVFLVTMFVFGVWPHSVGEYDFILSNVFQVNNIAFSVQGNFKKDYDEIYTPRDNLDFKWQTAPGLNQKKNVILVLVESLGCNFTYICGSGPAYMPKVEKIAKNNLLFDNYYSSVPSTSLSYLAINKSIPVISTRPNQTLSLPYREKLYAENDLTQAFKRNGYNTKFISSTDLVFQMDKSIAFTSYDEVIDAKHKLFEKYQDRYVFNSVSDEVMFDEIINLTKQENGNFFYVTKTASNHSPYNSPLGAQNIQKAFEYTDNAIDDFIKKLESINYFEQGIVVLVGDHHAWESTFAPGVSASDLNKVPLIIVDGKHQGRIDHSQFSHASLGVRLQYMELPEYKFNRFNFNPTDANSKEYIFGYDYQKISMASLKYGDRETNILLSGNNTQIVNAELFSPDEQNDILGYLAWFR